MGDVIALSDITPSGAADRSQEPSPAGSRRGRITPNLSRASSDADHGVSRRVLGGVGERDRLTDWGEQGGTEPLLSMSLLPQRKTSNLFKLL